MQARHISLIAHVIPAVVLSAPSAVMASQGWIIPLLFYNFVILLSMIVGFSNRLYFTEIDNTAWKRFYALLSLRGFGKKNIKPNHN
jgi:hypothetical protein